MTKKVFVVTDSDLGWDNVVGVFDASLFTREQLEKVFNSPSNYVDERTIESSLDGWDICTVEDEDKDED